jgi:hypothetical protein
MVAAGSSAVLLGVAARSALRNWGARASEVTGRYLGDELLTGQASTTTYAVTVDAPPQAVWAWLVQIGQGRGGMYSYEWLENLFGLDIHNADELRPEWQHLAVGDQVRVVPPGKLAMPDGYAFRVAIVDPPRALVLRQQPPEHPWNATWAFLVVPDGQDRCRLLSRSRSARLSGIPGLVARAGEELMRPLILVMTRRMLLGIKERAERQTGPTAVVSGKDPETRASQVTAAPTDRGGPEDAGIGAAVDLYWLPLGAGGHLVRWNGRLFEALAARYQHRERSDLYHAGLKVRLGGERYVIEQAPAWNLKTADRGVMAEGPVGFAWLGRYSAFRYEIRCWRDGIIPDIAEAVDSPRSINTDPLRAQQLLDLVPQVPTPVWGRRPHGAAEMWNSNSVISWLLAHSGHDVQAIQPPPGGRAPGWSAGLISTDQSINDGSPRRSSRPI